MRNKIQVLFSRFNLRTKLMGSVSLLMLLTIVVGAVSQRTIFSLKTSVFTISSATTSADWLAQANSFKTELLLDTWIAGHAYDVGKAPSESQLKDIETAATNFQDSITKYSVEAQLSSKEKATFDKLQTAIPILRSKVSTLISALRAAKAPRAEMTKSLETLSDDALNASDLLSELSGYVKQKGGEAAAAAREIAHMNTLIGIWILVFGLVNVACLFFFLRRQSDGMARSVDQLSEGTLQVRQASGDINAMANRLATNANEAAASLQETAAALEEVSATVKKNSETTLLSTSYSKKSQEVVTGGREAVSAMLRAMQEIESSNLQILEQNRESKKEFSAIIKVIGEIENKTKVINDIVFQTKLLSFNASVEAARAGEHGKGFAVVAEEVGNLAAMSGKAAQEISAMLKASIQQVDEIVQNAQSKVQTLIESAREKVSTGISTAQQCGTIFDEVIENVNSVDRMIQEISIASEEQSRGVDEISKAMSLLDASTHQTASAANEASSASSQLTNESDHLKSQVNQLFSMVHGSQQTSEEAKPDESTASGSDDNLNISLAS